MTNIGPQRIATLREGKILENTLRPDLPLGAGVCVSHSKQMTARAGIVPTNTNADVAGRRHTGKCVATIRDVGNQNRVTIKNKEKQKLRS